MPGRDLVVVRGAASIEQFAMMALATVVSRPTPDRAILDAGSKALTLGYSGVELTIEQLTWADWLREVWANEDFQMSMMNFLTPREPNFLQYCRWHGVRPYGWTVSGCGFAGLPDVMILVLSGAEIAESRVEPALVVDLLDEVRKVVGNILEAVEGHGVDCFDLQGFHEALGLGVIIRISPPAH